jgi:hypothetical protein
MQTAGKGDRETTETEEKTEEWGVERREKETEK